MSFTSVVVAAVVVTLAILGVAFLQPAYLLPTVISLGVLGAAPFVLRYVRSRAAALAEERRAARSYSVEPFSRVKATVEAFNLEAKPDIPELVDYMLQQAVLQQASDVHLVPYRDFTLVRYRVDGILTDVAQASARGAGPGHEPAQGAGPGGDLRPRPAPGRPHRPAGGRSRRGPARRVHAHAPR